MVIRRIRRLLGFIVGLIGILAILFIWFVYSGRFNVSATYPDSAPFSWVMSTIADRSVQRHAEGIKVPSLEDPEMIEAGLRHYEEDCVMCHGAPGVPIGEIGRGLNPSPPELTEAAADWKPNELFWITKNGIRMTGMPAWGVSQSDDEIWQTVAFMKKLPSMTSDQYRELTRQTTPIKIGE